ncbi:uncharacterized protein LOC129589668 [Paramacrobiotus metropolitanus]|uniref:uncharacterized protein LOC129589668 n=1 Tax=Paramacrobiotus metropolitanus TaxID=2943436 RepID=UPI002446080C|nr:uncharacterized protein LOC129589668 [Paramacrobiotus metropolitanus]
MMTTLLTGIICHFLILIVADHDSTLGRQRTDVLDDDSVDSSDLFEGDIIDYNSRDMISDELNATYANFMDSARSRWPQGIVPYDISYGIGEMELTPAIHSAMDTISRKTANCIRFRPRTNETAFLLFVSSRSICKATLGYARYGKNTIGLSRQCAVHDIVHELLHVLGYHHEHTRPDRDNYITVHLENIRGRWRNNYVKRNDVDLMGFPYDYHSIMHYPSEVGSVAENPQKPVMTTKNGVVIKHNTELSDLDVQKILAAYKCQAKNSLCNTSAGYCHVYIRGLETTENEYWLKTYVAMTNCHHPSVKRISVYCTTNATADDVQNIANQLTSFAHVDSYAIYIADASVSRPRVLSPVKTRITQLGIHTCTQPSTTLKLRENTLVDLLDFRLFYCSNQEIRKADFQFNSKLKRLVFHATTIASIERNAFDALAELEIFQLEEWWKPREQIVKAKREAEVRRHLQLLHCDCQYQWLRNWLNAKSLLANTKSLVNTFPEDRESVTVGEMYIPINCRSIDSSFIAFRNRDNTRFFNHVAPQPFSRNVSPGC